MTTCKKLIPSIQLQLNRAVDYLSLSRKYCDNGADALLICDLSKQDDEHEWAIGMIKEIVRNVDIPVIVGGAVKRLEDIKKYLYAGAASVYLDAEKEEQIDLIKEGADRFGAEKIYAFLSSVDSVKRIEEFGQLGASAMMLAFPETELAAVTLPLANYFVLASTEDEDAVATYLKQSDVEGVFLTSAVDQTLVNIDFMDWKQKLKSQGIAVATLESSLSWNDLKKNPDGLIPAIIQDYKTNEVLMLAYMNEEAFWTTLQTGKMTYYSRSRESLWIKGETSGHYQYVKALGIDCDRDTILAKVKQVGAACHTGNRSCFYTNLAAKEYKESNPLKVFEEVFHVISDRKVNPKEGSYTNYLFDKGIDKILKKLGEEATEIVIAAKNPNPEEIKYEISDFLYHMMVLMAEKGISWEEITEELSNR